jgi:hypothetical protein
MASIQVEVFFALIVPKYTSSGFDWGNRNQRIYVK